MQVRFCEVRIEPNRFLELTHGAIPILLLSFERTQGIVQGRIFGSSSQCVLRLCYCRFGLLGGSKRSYVENRHVRRQRRGGIAIERSKLRQRLFMITRLLVGDGEIHLSSAVVGLERECPGEFANGPLILPELQ